MKQKKQKTIHKQQKPIPKPHKESHFPLIRKWLRCRTRMVFEIEKFPKWVYNFIFLITFCLFLITTALLPYAFRNITHTGWKCVSKSGIITSIDVDTDTFSMDHFRKRSIHKYYANINDQSIRISKSLYYSPSRGDTFSYYEYTLGPLSYDSIEHYAIYKGFPILILFFIICLLGNALLNCYCKEDPADHMPVLNTILGICIAYGLFRYASIVERFLYGWLP